MSVETTTEEGELTWGPNWGQTALVGLLGGIPFGLIIHFWMGDMIDVGALYGAHSVTRGWAVHLLHSVIGALVFAILLGYTRLKNYVLTPLRKVIGGLSYGFVLWAVSTVVILPIWLEMMTPWGGGTPVADSDLRLPASLIGFMTYGLIVGGFVPPSKSLVINSGERKKQAE